MTAQNNWYEKYQVHLRPQKVGDWEIRKITVSEQEAGFDALRALINRRSRCVRPGTYTQLLYKNSLVMSDTPDEIRDHLDAIHKATGRCIVAGLGLGMYVSAILKKPEVTDVLVIEKSPEVIQMVGKTLARRFKKRLSIIQADIFEWYPTFVKYDTIWFDIWNDICTDNLTEMAKLHQRFKNYKSSKGAYMNSWSREICLDQKRRFGGWR